MTKTISKQREWQLRKKAAGLCTRCGSAVAKSTLCDPCRAINRTECRNVYRRKKGIPLDAPILRGRPREF